MSSTENSIVEVVVGGVKMRYPSCYVLVTDLDEVASTTTLVPHGSTSPTTVIKADNNSKYD